MDIQAYNIDPRLKDYLRSKNISKFTPIQDKVIPKLLKNKSVVAKAPTGSGKTFSFLFPLITNLNLEENKPQVIIFVPTRELGMQIKNEVNKINKFFDNKISSQLIIGGKEKSEDTKKYGKNHIIITTPSRILEIQKINPISLTSVQNIVIDEIDMTIDFGFYEMIVDFSNLYLKKIINVSVFSATLNKNLEGIIKKDFKFNFERIDIESDVEIKNYFIKNEDKTKYEILLKLINSNLINPYLALIFAKSNEEVNRIYSYLKKNNVEKLDVFNSDLTPRERKRLIKNLNNDQIVFLVTTDLMARGMDFPSVTHIINFDIPIDNQYYIHRIGRTNRNLYSDGHIYTIVNDDELLKLRKIAERNNIKLEKVKIQK